MRCPRLRTGARAPGAPAGAQNTGPAAVALCKAGSGLRGSSRRSAGQWALPGRRKWRLAREPGPRPHRRSDGDERTLNSHTVIVGELLAVGEDIAAESVIRPVASDELHRIRELLGAPLIR